MLLINKIVRNLMFTFLNLLYPYLFSENSSIETNVFFSFVLVVFVRVLKATLMFFLN